MKRSVISIAVALSMSILFCQLSAAQAPGADNPCKADIAKLCKGVKPGQGNVASCLKENNSKLSPACKTYIGGMHKGMGDFKDSCKPDIAKFCKNTKQGDGRIFQCLKEHEAELSPTCKPLFSKK